MAVIEHRFRVMACRAEVLLVDGNRALAHRAQLDLDELEMAWSRFVPTSDISRLNTARGRPVLVGPDTLVLVTAMVEAWHLTGGRFDPTTLPSLIANGYATSRVDPRRTTELPDEARSGGDLNQIVIDPVNSTVSLPVGLVLDPGGLGKGLAADLVAARLLERGARGALVGVGGDLVAVGEPPEPEGWLVVVEDPWDPGRDLCTLRIDSGAVATSSTRTCRWERDGISHHHLIDPTTGAEAGTDLAAVTVFAPTAWEAEALATGALLTGSADALDFLDGHDVDGIAVTDSGRILTHLTGLDALTPAPGGALPR